MISHLSLPLRTTHCANAANRLVARQGIGRAIAMLFNLGVVLRRNHRFNMLRFQYGVHLPFIVGAVAVKLFHRLVNPAKHVLNGVGVVAAIARQYFSDNLPRVRIDRQMQLSPSPPLGFAVRPRFPFALAKHLHARAVDDDVDASFLVRDIQRGAQFCGPLRQRRVIRNRYIGIEQRDERSAETLGLSIGQFEQLSDGQQAFDRRIAADFCARIGMLPPRQGVVAKPDRDIPALNERLVVLLPVRDFVSQFSLCSHD